MKLAVLGGSFNPVHTGHLMLADEVLHRLDYDKILFIPVNLPPHKELALGATGMDRLEMLRLAVEDNPYFIVDSCEIDRGGISYSYDTVLDLERRYQSVLDGKIGLIIGDDLVAGFSTWKNPEQLAARVDIIVARRMMSPEVVSEEFPYPHQELKNVLFPVSSSYIRSAVGSGNKNAWRYLVPWSVYQYIIKHNLYEHRAD